MELHLLELRENNLGFLVVARCLLDRSLLGSGSLRVCIVGSYHPTLWDTLLLFRLRARAGRILVVCLFLLYLLIVRDVSWIGHSLLYNIFALLACRPPRGFESQLRRVRK